jgi:Leucine-rich repeat (LRR) protein
MLNLNYLALGGGISYLPPEIGNCKQLQHLHLGGNSLDSLPAEIGKLSQLRNLSLHNNSLTTLTPEIGKLYQLRTLYLNNNFILTSLPPEIANLKDTLNYLDLSGCPISEEEKAKIRAWLPNTQITF